MAQHPNLKNACLSGFAFWLQGSLRNCPAYLARPKDTQILVVSSHHLAPSLRKLDNHAYTSTKPACGLTKICCLQLHLDTKSRQAAALSSGMPSFKTDTAYSCTHLGHDAGRWWGSGAIDNVTFRKKSVSSANVGAVFMYRVTIKISLAGPRKTTSGGGGGLLKPHQHYPFLGEGNHGSTPLRRMS